jgi:hypothetical protein
MTYLYNEQAIKYKRVGGWLLFLCLSLTIFSPIMTIRNLVTSYIDTYKYYGNYPALKDIFYLDTIFSVILTFLGIRAGIALWRIKLGAVTIAKNYLYIFIGYVIIAVFLPFMAGLPTESNQAMIPVAIFNFTRALAFTIIWVSYLNISKRVKATYATNQPADESFQETSQTENTNKPIIITDDRSASSPIVTTVNNEASGSTE